MRLSKSENTVDGENLKKNKCDCFILFFIFFVVYFLFHDDDDDDVYYIDYLIKY